MGGGGNKGEAESVTTYQPAVDYMPTLYKTAAEQSLLGYQNMPSYIPINYGGQTYQMGTTFPLRALEAATQMYSPQPAAQYYTQTSESAPQFCGMSCFIFVEAERDKKLRELRWFRDSHFPRGCTVQSGYSKMSRFIIPLMRRSKLFKKLIQMVMTSPLIAFAKWYYKKNRYGFIFYPLAWMWRNVWWTIGKFLPVREYTWKEFYEVTKETRYDILYSPNIQ